MAGARLQAALTKTAFTRECLGEFCQYLYHGQPLFRTVGNDSMFYRPPTTNQLTRYLSQIPEDFEMCSKVWEEITIPTYAQHARYGVKAGQPNPRLLDAGTYDKIVGELPEMRRDTLKLVRQTTGEGRASYVLVNNRAESNALLTIQAIVDASLSEV